MSKEYQPKEYAKPTILGESILELLQVSDMSTIRILNPWHQGGAETYVADFLLDTGEADKAAHLIAKACIKMCAKEVLKEWFGRRTALADNGVNFPVVYAVDYDGATWVEEFIPYTFMDVHKQARDIHRSDLEEQYLQTYLRIKGAGFSPLGALHDVRSRGADVVMIDVGADIGGQMRIQSCGVNTKTEAEQSLEQAVGR